MITRPLDLAARLGRVPRDLDVMHWLSVVTIVAFFALAGSRFVLAPGLLMGEDPAFAPPALGAEAQLVATAPVVVGFRRDNVILFEGGVYKRLVDLAGPLEMAGRQHRGEILYVLADRQVSALAITEFAELAVKAGFAGVHLAGAAAGAENPQPFTSK